MLTALATVGLALSPLLIVLALLELGSWWRRRRQGAVTRQIVLSDAIAEELGAIVAPVVTRPLLGPWTVRIAVPFGRPATLGRILAVAHQVLARMCGGGYEIVLVPQAEPAMPLSRLSLRAPRAKAA